MKEIQLTQGKAALVDDDLFVKLSSMKWHAHKSRNTFYAYRWTGNRIIAMHSDILECPKGYMIDHINGNGLDNRKENLRICTPSQNQINKRKQKNNKSGYKGVSWNKRDKNWKTQLKINSKLVYWATFSNIEDAARAYDKAAIKYHGKYAKLNFPSEK